MVLKYGHLVNSFLDWLVERRALVCNPIAELRRKYSARSTTAVLRAVTAPRPEEALMILQPPPPHKVSWTPYFVLYGLIVVAPFLLGALYTPQ